MVSRKLLTMFEIPISQNKRWDVLLAKSLYPSYRAHHSYISANSGRIIKKSTFIFQNENEDIGGAHYTLISFGVFRIASISSGLVFINQPDIYILTELLNHFEDWAKENRAIYLKLNSWFPNSIKGELTDLSLMLSSTAQKLSFHVLTQGRHTYWIDLSLSEKELFSNMDKETRNRVRAGIREGLEIEIVNEITEEVFEKFYNLYQKRGERNKFSIISKARMKTLVFAMGDSKIGNIVFTKYHSHILYASFISNFGISAGLYSAMNPDFKKIDNCPAPGQFTYWKIIEALKKQGLKVYDLGFCPGAIPDKTHPAYNIWRFKYRFGGMHVQYSPLFGKVLHPIFGRLYQLFRYRKL